MNQKFSISEITLKVIPNIKSDELSEDCLRRCSFCEKYFRVSSINSKIINKLSGSKNIYCSFCLRNDFNNKKSNEILILSFRCIFAYLYFSNYVNSLQNGKMWISEIQDIINRHQKVGEENPLFVYDANTMLWFINFSKIGKNKASLDDINKTIKDILESMNLEKNIFGLDISSFYQKYYSAIELFYKKRHRPKGKKMLIPTLLNTGVVESKNYTFEKMKNFTLNDLKFKR